LTQALPKGLDERRTGVVTLSHSSPQVAPK
jgi:hypothetical protein